MKFQCDRCRTRYSIADERVRGKILKIRCKNCSAVITVREGMGLDDDASLTASRRSSQNLGQARCSGRLSAGPVASSQAIAVGAGRNTPAPVPPEDDDPWFVSIDGESNGPFSLGEARAWLAARTPDEELYCWRASFDDWLSVHDVSELSDVWTSGSERRLSTDGRAATQVTPQPGFAVDPGLERPLSFDEPPVLSGPADGAGPQRKPTDQAPLFAAKRSAGANPAAVSAGPPEAAPEPIPHPFDPSNALTGTDDEPSSDDLFAAALSNAAAGSGTEASASAEPAHNGHDRANAARISDEQFNAESDDDIDFEIGEPSKIVKLPMLVAAHRQQMADEAAAEDG
ncbi:MAG: GYF domain-containing protein, partial [Myxococcota bacterium]